MASRRLVLAGSLVLFALMVSACGETPTVRDVNARETLGSSTSSVLAPTTADVALVTGEQRATTAEPTLEEPGFGGILELGACESEPATHQTSAVGAAKTATWVTGDTITSLGPADFTDRPAPADESAYAAYDLSSWRLVGSRGEVPASTIAVTADMERLANELQLGATAMLALDPFDITVYPVSVRPDGTVAFVGDCRHLMSEQFASFYGDESSYRSALIDRGLGDPAGLLTALIEEVDDGIYDLLRPQAAPTWHELDPSLRILNPAVTPAEVLDGLDLINLRFELPGAWLASSASLCTRIDLGWNDCTALNLDPIELDAWVDAGQDLTVWFLDEGGHVADPVFLLGSIDAAAVQAAIDGPGITFVTVSSPETNPYDLGPSSELTFRYRVDAP